MNPVPVNPAPATRTLSEADFAAPIDDRYFEDYVPGAAYEYGYLQVTEAEIIEFARAFDPQPIHIDPDFAASGPFGGLIASGWHSAGLFTRLFVTHYVSRPAGLASRQFLPRGQTTQDLGPRRCRPGVFSRAAGSRSLR